ncbi:cation-transporting P-type ATPase [Methanolobus sp. ZRKC2]|uniref:cation-translocating P-type ATPase n=1 Tax=Methanolobus sp. ZRKC2 TaxID=3125783 RepID=UPI00324F9ED8
MSSQSNETSSSGPAQKASKTKWYALDKEEVAKQLQVDPSKGLSAEEAQKRLQQYGPNHLEDKKKESGWQAFLRQYKDLMQKILLVAAAVNQIFTGDWKTTMILVVLTIFNALLGLRGEAKATASLAELSGKMKINAHVRRDGKEQEIDISQIVPGDIAIVEAGDIVPADGRLFVAATLETEEAALTGESTASSKNSNAIEEKEEVSIGDRHNMVYMNTSVTRGRGEIIVTTTGMGTEMGHIAELLNKTKADKTPLQKQLDRLTMIIAAIAGLAFVLMVILGLESGQSINSIFAAGVALAISAIPTGLPAVVITMYSMGTQVLAAQNAIVKRLPSVETLGSVSAICTDKTGTLTLNKMTAREFSVPAKNHYKVTGEGYSTQGQLFNDGGTKIDLDEVLQPMVLCSDARLDGEELIGDPTEGALIVLAAKGGIDLEGLRKRYPRIAEVPFDAEYKFMATFHNMTNTQGKPVVRCCVKGAPDVLIARAGSFWLPGDKVHPITEENKSIALEENKRMASSGERVMVVARRDFDPDTFDPDGNLMDMINDLTLLAMVGIVDPPRSEAKDAISKCHKAGIQVRMITGDHAVTAASIGEELGIEGKALTGAQFAAIPDEKLKTELDQIGVIARVTPEDKLRLVTLLQEKDNIVSMTGDGVNDAPALKKADIGVAMGITGTEVSKNAAVMILTDDNFATIVKAVEYGRYIYNNLFNFVRYQMQQLVAFIACYLLAAIFVVLGGTPFTAPVVLLLRFLVEVPIALALGFGEMDPNLMDKKPRPLKQPLLSSSQWIRITFLGVLSAMVTVYLEALYEPSGTAIAATVGFVSFAMHTFSRGISASSETETSFNRDVIHDRNQVGLYGGTLLITILATELDFMQRILGTTSLSAEQWFVCIAAAIGILLIDEIIKFFMRRSRSHNTVTTEAIVDTSQ